MFKSALDGALPVNAICTALIFVFGSLLKTDERRSSVTLWGRSAQSQTPNKLHLLGKSRWRRTPFASVPIGTVYFDGQPNRSSSLIRCHSNFGAPKNTRRFLLTYRPLKRTRFAFKTSRSLRLAKATFQTKGHLSAVADTSQTLPCIITPCPAT